MAKNQLLKRNQKIKVISKGQRGRVKTCQIVILTYRDGKKFSQTRHLQQIGGKWRGHPPKWYGNGASRPVIWELDELLTTQKSDEQEFVEKVLAA